MGADRGQGQPNEVGAGREEVFKSNGGLVATAYGLSDVGCQRPVNQDTLGNRVSQFAAKAPTMGLLYAVADGMGGHARGEVASARAIDELFARYYAANPATEPRQALAQAMVETNGAVHRAGKDAGGGTMGTTLTTVLLRHNILYVGNIGDSRTYLVRGGRIKQLSYDHSLIGEQVRSGLLTEAQARTSTIRNVITRAVGYRDVVEPDTFAFTVNAGDILLLCSDGLHGYVENEELARHLSTQALKGAIDALIDLAKERGGPDNITALAVRIDQIGEVVLSEDDERTTEVEILAPDDQATKPLPIIRAQHTDEIVADLPPPPPAVAPPPRPAAQSSPPPPPQSPPPPPLAAPPIDHKAKTQTIQRAAPGAPAGPPPSFAPPPGPAPALPAPAPALPAAPARRGRPPLWFFLLLPLLLLGIIAAGVVAVGLRNGRSAATPTVAPAVGGTRTGAATNPTTTPVPASAPTTTPPPASAAPQATIAPVPTQTSVPAPSRPIGSIPPLPTAGVAPPVPVEISGTITFEANVAIPANFPGDWEVAFYDPAEWREKKQAAVPQHRARISSAGNGSYSYTATINLATGLSTPYTIQVRQTDGKQIATSPTTEVTVPTLLRVSLPPLAITGFGEPQAPPPSPSPTGEGLPGRGVTNDGLIAALRWALAPLWRELLQSLYTLR